MEQFRELLKALTAERGGLARLSERSGIPSPVLGRWRDGIGRPTDTNLKKLAPALGVPYEDLAKMCGYLPGEAETLDPRLASFLAEIETGWRNMDQQTREVAERGTLALFRVEDVRRRPRPERRVTKSDQGFDRDKGEEVHQPQQRIRPVTTPRKTYPSHYVKQSVPIQKAECGFQPAYN
jgi:transcriptional regulator with XRE-family HTH domain